MMKTNLFVPHIDKTGGVSLTNSIKRELDTAGWTYDHDARIKSRDNLESKNHACLGMHNPYYPEFMDADHWFKFLVLREPYSRFLSTYNYYKFEVWRDSGSYLNISIEEYIDLIIQKNLGYHTMAAHHIGTGFEYDVYTRYVELVLNKFPWSILMKQRGYIDSLTSLNSEKIETYPDYTIDNLFDRFDVVIDTSRFDEIPHIFKKYIGIEITVDKVQNSKEDAFNIIAGNPRPATMEDLTNAHKAKLNLVNAFRIEDQLWKTYKKSKHANTSRP